MANNDREVGEIKTALIAHTSAEERFQAFLKEQLQDIKKSIESISTRYIEQDKRMEEFVTKTEIEKMHKAISDMEDRHKYITWGLIVLGAIYTLLNDKVQYVIHKIFP